MAARTGIRRDSKKTNIVKSYKGSFGEPYPQHPEGTRHIKILKYVSSVIIPY